MKYHEAFLYIVGMPKNYYSFPSHNLVNGRDYTYAQRPTLLLVHDFDVTFVLLFL